MVSIRPLGEIMSVQVADGSTTPPTGRLRTGNHVEEPHYPLWQPLQTAGVLFPIGVGHYSCEDEPWAFVDHPR